MGAITDHAFEHLGPSDRMITRTRRRVLLAARAFRETGLLPPEVADPSVFLQARSGFFLTAPDVDWQRAYADQLAAALRPAASRRAAE